MALEAQLIAGPIGPDTISIPGDPDRLNRSAAGLREMCETLGEVGEQLQQSAAAERRGRTTKALIRVAGRTGHVLKNDVNRLTELGDGVQQQADLLTDAQGGLDELRGRWRQARQELREVVNGEETRRAAEGQGGGNGGGNGNGGGGGNGNGGGGPRRDPLDAMALIRDIDDEVAQEHEGTISRLTGVQFGSPSGGRPRAFLVDEKLDQAMDTYRRNVRQVLEDFTQSIRRVHRADEAMSEHLPRKEEHGAVLSAQPARVGAGTAENPEISGPEEIESVAEEAQQAARALNRAADQLREIRLGIREGRMLPDDERIGSSDGFQRTWSAHFDDLREDLNHARKSGADIAARLREIDQDGERAVWRPGREG